MKEREDFPYSVETTEHASIALSDGTRLAARIWKPRGAEQDPVPAIFEFIPYRKRDFEALGDSVIHPWFAGHGYASVRVDLRGSGESEGVLEDEYLPQEQQDALEVLDWIAGRDWCDGNIGMMGISWGGFNALQLAALQPEPLKAIITVCSTDDRYADDIHYMGGCLLGDQLSWASVMFGYNSLPPDPELAGEKWREMWRHRMEGSGLWLKNWLEHQRRDGFWKHGSVCEDISKVQIPVYAVSGWADGYSNAVFRLMRDLDVPRQGLVGPWSHMYPHLGKPGPAIGFLQEARRWWDHWLKGRDNGVEDEPVLKAYMQDSAPPQASYEERPGRWVAESEWTDSEEGMGTLYLSEDGRLKEDSDQQGEALSICSPLGAGLHGGKWCSYSLTPDLPLDQRYDEGGALNFTTAPLEEDFEILGAPRVELELSADRPVAQVAVRLSDVRPDGSSTRVTYGLLNLTHRDSHENPEELVPGERYRVQVRMNEIAQRFPAGHRIRLSISSSYFPIAWPAPEPVELTLYPDGSSLQLPERAPKPELDDEIHFEEAEGAVPTPTTRFAPKDDHWRIEKDLGSDRTEVSILKDDGKFRFDEWDWTVARKALEEYSFEEQDPNSLRGEVRIVHELEREGFHVLTDTRTILTSDTEHFHIDAELIAYEGEEEVYRRRWRERVPRDLV